MRRLLKRSEMRHGKRRNVRLRRYPFYPRRACFAASFLAGKERHGYTNEMTPQPKLSISLPRLRRRVVRRKVVRLAPPRSATPDQSLTGAQLAERFKNRKPNPYNDVIMEHIEAARVADRQKALDEGLPWD